eukprot:SM000034S12698  [mRNA]  locus=s34:253115:255176:- [translate_table: standard]
MAAIAPTTPASSPGLLGPCWRSLVERRQSKAKAALPRAWPWPAAAEAARRDGGDGAAALQVGAGGATYVHAPAQERAAAADAEGLAAHVGPTGHLRRRRRRPLVDACALLRQRPSGDATAQGDADLEPREPWLPAAPAVTNPRSVHNAASLAYLGDAIYELYARLHFLAPQRIEAYSDRVTAVVCCEAQHSLLCALLEDDFLSEDERACSGATAGQGLTWLSFTRAYDATVSLSMWTVNGRDVLRWGRNVTTGQRRAKGRAGSAIYSSATSLETLIGYLYLTDEHRLKELMAQLGFHSGQAFRAQS